MRIQLIVLTIFINSGLIAKANDIFEGYRTFGEEKYDSTLYYFQKALDEGSTWSWLPELIETVEKRKSMGNINPESIHQVGFIFVTQLTIHKADGSVEVLPDVTPEQKAEWDIYFKMLGKVLETFSDGNWTLKYDTISALSEYIEGDEAKPDNPDHLHLVQ